MTDTCGAWGGCPLPPGHNQGRADIPENHHGLSEDLFTGPQWDTRDPETEESLTCPSAAPTPGRP